MNINMLVADILIEILVTLLIFIALLVFQKVMIYGGWFAFGVSYM